MPSRSDVNQRHSSFPPAGAAFWDDARQLTRHGEAVPSLLNDRWRTQVEAVADASGVVEFTATDGKHVLARRLDALLRQVPYEVVRAPAEVVDLAEEQVKTFPRHSYCPTLDRLHLAAMKSLDVRRLLTNDDAQARAARAMGFAVVTPR